MAKNILITPQTESHTCKGCLKPRADPEKDDRVFVFVVNDEVTVSAQEGHSLCG